MLKKFYKTYIILPAQVAISLYLILAMAIYPLYIRNGYYDIDFAKYQFISIATGLGIIIIIAECVIQLYMKHIPPQLKSRLSCTDWCMVAYLAANLASYALADNRDVALWGQSGWYMGTFVIVMFALMYLCITRFYLGSSWIIYMILIVSEVVFLLGILNRFGIWPVPIKIVGEHSYLSTLGNIGWYSSYIAVIAPLGIGLYIINNKQKLWMHILLAVYAFTVFVTGLSQGGDSIFIFFAVILLGTLFVASVYDDGLKNWLEMVMLWCLAGQLVHLIRRIWPDSYGYDSENICGRFNNSFASLWILIPVALIYAIVVWKKIQSKGVIAKAMRDLPVVLVAIALAWFVAAVIYSNAIGIGLDKESLSSVQKLFYIDMLWGGGRGTAMNIGLNIWLEQGIGGKLIGIGPDCFTSYIANSPKYANLVLTMFGYSLLTNAHNEFLTNLANIGVLGVIAYYGIFVSYIYRCSKFWKKDMRVIAIALCLIGYNGYNVLNYAELINYPFYILLIALGETWMKHADMV